MLSWKMKMEVFTFPAAWQLRCEHITWSPSVPFPSQNSDSIIGETKKKKWKNDFLVAQLWHQGPTEPWNDPGGLKCHAKGLNFILQGLGAMEGSIWGALFSDVKFSKISQTAAWRMDWIQQVWRQTSAGWLHHRSAFSYCKTLRANTAILVFYDWPLSNFATSHKFLPTWHINLFQY